MIARPIMTVLMGAFLANAASARPPLLEVESLISPLVEARAADIVRKGCPAYSVNMVRAYSEAKKLERAAVSAGYPKSEVKSFIRDKGVKAEIYRRSDALLRRLGFDGQNEDSLCAAGDALVSRGGIAARLISR